jgi:omega-6 fatty acid desaturase (delta-12 desaturase)
VFDWLGWATYAFWQGTAFTGWWVLAHECGHGGFSASTALNDTVGYVLHTVLLVPYFAWQYSHAKHHSKTNHIIDGESHVPDTYDDLEDIGFVQLYRLVGRPAYAILQLIFHLVFGWPAYLLFNVTGGRRLAGKPVKKPFNFTTDHFRPNSDLFPPSWRGRIAVSTLGIFFVFGVIAWAVWHYGAGAVVAYYFMPYLWCNFWLVLYTWMQHTDPTVPHYGDSEWTWLRGALCTIDRPYGIFDWFHHHIGSTHVCHHLFSKLPCYNAVKATEHLKAYLEPKGLYRYDPTFWPIAAWRVAMTCHYIEGVEGIQYYKQLHSKADDKEEQSYEPHLWYIHGNAYDLAPFVEKHPGGQFAILSARGRECTALFESYHPWSDKNRKVLAAYGPKPPPCDPFYEEMKLGVRKLFPGGPKETKMRTWTLCCLLAAWATTMYLMFYVKTWWSCLGAGVLIALFGTRLAHEGGHMQASHKAWLNRLCLFLGYLPVGPGLCWYYRHVISHHVHTNQDHDVDVKYIELLDVVPKCLKYVKVMLLPVIFAGAVFEIGVKTLFDMLFLKDCGGCRVYPLIGLLLPETMAWFAIHLAFGPSLLCYACMAFSAGAIFVPMSQVAHAILYPDGVQEESWAKMQLKSSVNFAARSSFWYHMAFGLTTQTDHHLFPGIGAHCLDDIHDHVVKPVCAKHQVPVYDVSAKKAFGALWYRLLNCEPAKIF